MNETSAEQLPAKDRAEQLQGEFGRYVDKLHQFAGETTQNSLSAQGTYSKDTAAKLADELLDFNMLYRSIPEGYHLNVGLSPLKWHEMQRDEDLRLLTRKEMTPVGPQYWLKTARFIDNQAEMDTGLNALNLNVIGTNNPENPTVKIQPWWVSKDIRKRAGTIILPEDILAVKLVENPKKP